MTMAVLAGACSSASTVGPDFSAGDRVVGAERFEALCSACHGPVADGTTQGPPLVDRIYRPGHHADAAFLLAVRRGVSQHHWRFGQMPPQPEVTDAEIADIVAFVRALQREAGIE